MIHIGHSTRTIEEFIELLEAHGIEKILDIRRGPKLRYCPQFNQEALKRVLKRSKIGYRYIKELSRLAPLVKMNICQ